MKHKAVHCFIFFIFVLWSLYPFFCLALEDGEGQKDVQIENAPDNPQEDTNTQTDADEQKDTDKPSSLGEQTDTGEKEDSKTKGGWEGNLTIASEYLSRGISQSDRHAALQGGVEYDLKTGYHDIIAYGGVWGSNVDFDDNSHAFMELDNMFGLRGSFGKKGIDWDIGAIYYVYPGVNHRFNYNYWEIPLLLSYSPVDETKLGLQYYYSPDYSGNTSGSAGNGHFVNGTVEIKHSLPVDWAKLVLNGAVGYQWVENNANAGFDNFATWNMGPTLKIQKIDFSALYSSTTLSKQDCYKGKTWCGDTVLFSAEVDF